MNLHPTIRAELDNLAIQFPGQAQIDLDQYAALYKIKRADASRHLRRRNIPATKEGRTVYISMLDLATYKAKRKSGNEPLVVGFQSTVADEMRNRRGFCQMAEQRQMTE